MEISKNYTPCIFYIFLAVLPIYLQYTYTNKINVGFILHICFTILWIFFLYFLSSYGFNNIAWILVALPYLFGYFVLRILLEQVIADHNVLQLILTPSP
jgi:hypothetical protein